MRVKSRINGGNKTAKNLVFGANIRQDNKEMKIL